MKTTFYNLKLFTTTILLLTVAITKHAQNWNEVIKAAASDRIGMAQFGFSVAIDGDYAIVGANSEAYDLAGANNITAAGAASIG
ncbi:FG-GAP repeat protein [Bacteroidia bacterium]|nr:FG-GAP repeat protein [Bacteroidia bacterium]